MLVDDLVADLRSKINPQYAAVTGTESYERRLCAEALEMMRAENERLHTLARDARAAWDADRDARVGKLLRAMVDTDYCRTYRPDLMPNANWASNDAE